jgi:hypothetical protein
VLFLHHAHHKPGYVGQGYLNDHLAFLDHFGALCQKIILLFTGLSGVKTSLIPDSSIFLSLSATCLGNPLRPYRPLVFLSSPCHQLLLELLFFCNCRKEFRNLYTRRRMDLCWSCRSRFMAEFRMDALSGMKILVKFIHSVLFVQPWHALH